jgi:hypothetical protein
VWVREERKLKELDREDDGTEPRRELKTEGSDTTPAIGDGMAAEDDVDREI